MPGAGSHVQRRDDLTRPGGDLEGETLPHQRLETLVSGSPVACHVEPIGVGALDGNGVDVSSACHVGDVHQVPPLVAEDGELDASQLDARHSAPKQCPVANPLNRNQVVINADWNFKLLRIARIPELSDVACTHICGPPTSCTRPGRCLPPLARSGGRRLWRDRSGYGVGCTSRRCRWAWTSRRGTDWWPSR